MYICICNAIKECDLRQMARKTRGDDIDAACGQLVGKVRDRTRRSEQIRLRNAARGEQE